MARWAPLVERGPVLDLASGAGRHARLFAGRGLEVLAVDREDHGLGEIANIRFLKADLEDGRPWPLAGRRFAAIVVTNYLHRPLLPILPTCLGPGGVLIYQTFAVGNECFGRPSNPEFLLRPNELLESFAATLTVVGYEWGEIREPRPAVIQRICAVKSPDAIPRLPPAARP